ncbi:hypothetical protein [Pontibacter sp. SGAir0037]|uniref:hypothetical protein n=1 Tax=Pontibacter sp. SGAir0037 TaxID=2571030 RepID=UPI0010CD1594|nr:hypothetical protein [Pontibacter sp. SGAir0037]QCR22298.1 hypothetical protein C1N53_08090 [Pontibacter sp. SGAir0037]
MFSGGGIRSLSCASYPQAWDYLGIDEELSNNTIYKDHFGFMWFGTDDGLNQYNGYDFKKFRNTIRHSTSLIHNQVNVVARKPFQVHHQRCVN